VSTPENKVADVSYAAQDTAPQEKQPELADPSSAETGLSMQTEPTAPNATTMRQPLRIKWIALKPGNVYAVTKYLIHEGSVTYVLSSGAKGSVDITEVDWRKTSHLNAEPIASPVTTRAAIAGDPESFSGRP
jgi:hypothetical protein